MGYYNPYFKKGLYHSISKWICRRIGHSWVLLSFHGKGCSRCGWMEEAEGR